MEYNEYKEMQKRMKIARKFLRISSTMMKGVKHVLSDNGIVCSGINNEGLVDIINSLDTYIRVYSDRYVPNGGQLDLFHN